MIGSSTPRAWRCVICGYIHHGASPCQTCPICGAPASEFEPFYEQEVDPILERQVPKEKAEIVIIGGGIAGFSAAEAIRRQTKEANVTILSREDDLPYYRLNLTRFIAGEVSEEDLIIQPASWYEQQNIRLLTKTEVLQLSLASKTVQATGRETIPFSKLILTSGAEAFLPQIPGINLSGVVTLRTLADARYLLELAKPGTRCVCIGGGLLGLETAGALARKGLDLTLLEGHNYLMPRQLNRNAGRLLGETLSTLGIKLLTQARTKLISGKDKVSGVLLENGDNVPADLVILATGVVPSVRLSVTAGLKVNRGVVIDNFMFSSDKNLLAAGDIAEHKGVCYGAWNAAQYQGSIAGMNALGLKNEFGGIPRSHSLKVLGLPVVSIGQFETEDPNTIVIEEEDSGNYRHFVFKENLLIGAILLGDSSAITAVTKTIEKKLNLSTILAGKPTIDELIEYLTKISE